MTTVGDLAKWDENFYTGRVGGKQVIADMLARGRLNNGREQNYASGLVIDKYRGLDTVWHNGSDEGYRTNILRFPSQHFSVILFSNATDINPGLLSERITDIYLHDRFKEPAPAYDQIRTHPPKTKVDPKLLEAYAGDYLNQSEYAFTNFYVDHGQFMTRGPGQDTFALYPSSDSNFFAKKQPVEVNFVRSSNGNVSKVDVHMDGQVASLSRLELPALNEAQLGQFKGQYYSDELGVIYSVTSQGGKLNVDYPRGRLLLWRTGTDSFITDYPIGTLKFLRNASHSVVGFTIDNGSVINLKFEKVELTKVQ